MATPSLKATLRRGIILLDQLLDDEQESPSKEELADVREMFALEFLRTQYDSR